MTQGAVENKELQENNFYRLRRIVLRMCRPKNATAMEDSAAAFFTVHSARLIRKTDKPKCHI